MGYKISIINSLTSYKTAVHEIECLERKMSWFKIWKICKIYASISDNSWHVEEENFWNTDLSVPTLRYSDLKNDSISAFYEFFTVLYSIIEILNYVYRNLEPGVL